MNQHEWVYGCYAYYLENYIEPGNPEDGVWEDAHWPVPKCKGGTKTIPLLKEHHAVHNVLQSEEWRHPCLWGWETAYLTGELLALCEKWISVQRSLAAAAYVRQTTPDERSERSRRAAAARPPEQRSESSRKGQARRTPEERRDSSLKANAAMAPEQKTERGRKGHAGYMASTTPEQRSDWGRKASLSRMVNSTQEERSEVARKRHAARTPEERSETARKAWETRRRNQQGG